MQIVNAIMSQCKWAIGGHRFLPGGGGGGRLNNPPPPVEVVLSPNKLEDPAPALPTFLPSLPGIAILKVCPSFNE